MIPVVASTTGFLNVFEIHLSFVAQPEQKERRRGEGRRKEKEGEAEEEREKEEEGEAEEEREKEEEGRGRRGRRGRRGGKRRQNWD